MVDDIENARPKGLLIPFDKFEILDILPPEQYKYVISTLMRKYVETGEEPGELEDLEKMAFVSLKGAMDTNIKTYRRSILANRKNGRKGGRPRKPTETDGIQEEPTKTHGFSEKPTETDGGIKYKVQSTTDTNVSDITTVVVKQSSADVDLARIVQQYEASIGTFPRSALDKLQGWREVFSTEMILLAINKAAESGKRSWNYINGILSNWQHSGVHTPGDAAASDENHKRPAGRGSSPRQPAESTRDQLARVLGNMDKERGFET